MQKRSSKKQGPEDLNEAAFRVFSDAVDPAPKEESEKNPAAVELGRMGGLKGGRARAISLSADQRSEIAKRAAAARWRKGSQDA